MRAMLSLSLITTVLLPGTPAAAADLEDIELDELQAPTLPPLETPAAFAAALLHWLQANQRSDDPP